MVPVVRFQTLCVLALGLLFFVGVHTVHAEEAGIKVIPATIEKPADPGALLNEEIKITNVNSEDKQFYIYKRDIVGVEANSVPVFADDKTEKTDYELTEWIDLPTEPITVKGGETVVFPFAIKVPETASPGSHFGGVFVSAEPPKMRQTGAGVGYEVATIISIRINGDISDNARVRSLSTNKLFFGTKDIDFVARVENQGNILIRPYGVLTISSMFGSDRSISVNDTLAGVFPGTIRDLEFSWHEDGIGFGRYEALVALVYDGKDGQKTIDASTVFWVFPAKIIIPVLLGLLVFCVAVWLIIRYYINQTLARAVGGRRISPYRYKRQVGISRFTFIFISILSVIVLFFIVLFVASV